MSMVGDISCSGKLMSGELVLLDAGGLHAVSEVRNARGSRRLSCFMDSVFS